MSFLPADYQAPKASSESYMKLQDGENKIRILTPPILGWETWGEDNKPIRTRMTNKPAKPADAKKSVRHFWSFVCWNYTEEKIQILNITQATIRNTLEALSKDAEWGAPYFYDIKIIRKGEGIDTEYHCTPVPPKKLNPEIKAAFEAKPCYLEALFDGADPFDKGWPEYTSGIFSEDQLKVIEPIKQSLITDEEVKELNDIINECNPLYRDTVMERLKHPTIKASSFKELTPSIFAKVKTEAIEKRAEFRKLIQEELDVGF